MSGKTLPRGTTALVLALAAALATAFGVLAPTSLAGASPTGAHATGTRSIGSAQPDGSAPQEGSAGPAAIKHASQQAASQQAASQQAASQQAATTASTIGCATPSGRTLTRAPGPGRTVALTIDDGPSAWTPGVLNTLRANGVHATFFVIGEQAAVAPATLRKIAAGGHQIGNHTWTHRYPRAVRGGWSRAFLNRELTSTSQAVHNATGQWTCVFRPPGGFMPSTVPVVAHALGMSVALWSVDTQDWKVQAHAVPRGSATSAAWSRQIVAAALVGLRQTHPVILVHDGGGYRGATLAALPRIIAAYRAHGYRFVRLDGRA